MPTKVTTTAKKRGSRATAIRSSDMMEKMEVIQVDGGGSENEDSTTPPSPRRGSARLRRGIAAVAVATFESNDNENDNDSNESDDNNDSESDASTNQKRVKCKTGNRAKQQKPSEETRRSSSRSNKFSSSLKEPSGTSIKDLFAQKGESARTQTRDRRDNDDDGNENYDDDKKMDDASSGDQESPTALTPQKQPKARTRNQKNKAAPKSPAVRHTTQRRRVKTEVQVTSGSESDDSDSDLSNADDEEDEDEIKIQRILASKTETRQTWAKMCHSINTSEIDYGSRWFQEDIEGSDNEKETATANSTNTNVVEQFEERFLVKWGDLSYLHCSWETQDDLIEQIDTAKTYLTTFFRKSTNGLLFSQDERCDGDYFDPAYTQIDRILEMHAPDNNGSKKNEYGIVMDKKDPKFEAGTGRQFLIKWINTPYSDCTYEFERDLILNEVEYKEHVDDFSKRSKKPLYAPKKKLDLVGEAEKRRVYKIFGDKTNKSDEERELLAKEYQQALFNYEFPNGGRIRDYQSEGVAWLMANHVNHRSSILADEMGLGKTIQTAAYVNQVATTLHKRGPFLIVAPLSTIPHWYREFSNWTHLNTIVYHGSAKTREIIREFEIPFEADRPKNGVAFNQSYLRKCSPKKNVTNFSWMAQVVITTPEMLVTDDFSELTAIQWEILVVDEAHRLKNHASKLANNLRNPKFTFHQKLLLTGTPIQNNMSELWTLLNIVDEDKFEDMDKFLEKYGDIKSKERIDELHEMIRPYILRRLKEDVEKSVPPKEETLIEVELTVLQKQYYRALYEKNVQFLHRNKKKALDGPSINNLAMQLRKCCNHPFLLNGVEDEVREQESKAGSEQPLEEADFLAKASGKLVLLDKLLPRLKENGHRVLIFSQFKIMLDILEDYLAARVMKNERIDGSITGSKRQMAIDRFQATAETSEKAGREIPFIMLLSTRAGGVGINLTAADTCIIFDSDWNPQNDLQAQARCHRIGQTKKVKVYRLLSRKTYEMQMFHMSSLKMGLDQAVLQGFENSGSADGDGNMTKEEVERLLRHGAYDIFNEEKAGAANAESNEFIQQDIDSILERRSKTVIHDNTGSKSNAAGGTFSKASFKAVKSSDSGAKKQNTEDVDIDDPEFWTKMVGEAQVEDNSADLAGKKRKRTAANYSEKDYDRRLPGTIMDGSVSETFSDNDSPSEDYSDEESETLSVEQDKDATTELGSTKVVPVRTKKRKKKRERTRWGGKSATGADWVKQDVEKLNKALQMYGYGNLPWDVFVGKVDFEREEAYTIDEIKRMCWSIVFVVIRGGAEEDGAGAAKRAERAAEKKRQSEGNDTPTSPSRGGILAVAVNSIEQGEDEKSRSAKKQEAFVRIWEANQTWLPLAVADAKAYATSNFPRAKEVFEHATSTESNKPLRSKEEEGMLSLFIRNIWPSLKSRGWKAELVEEGKYAGNTHYTNAKNQVYRSPQAVLAQAPSFHPELSVPIQSVVTAAAVAAEKEKDVRLLEVAKATLDPITPQSLHLFLQLYSPLQLLVERSKIHRKLHLSRKVLSNCTALKTANFLVKDVETTSVKDFTDQLVTRLHVDKRMALPHPAWTLRHDAVLILAIAKHGWIDHDNCCRDITEDSSIKWGAPFDDGLQPTSKNSETKESAEAGPLEQISKEEARKKEVSISLLKDTANRAAAFFSVENDMIQELKSFNQNLVIKAYGLVQQETSECDESNTNTWIVDDNLLKLMEDGADINSDNGDQSVEVVELPTKKDLLKRAKTVLSKASTTPIADCSRPIGPDLVEALTQPEIQTEVKHNYTILDQGDRCNILLAEMLRGLLRLGFSKKAKITNLCRKLCSHAHEEAQHLYGAIGALLPKEAAEDNEDPALVFHKEMNNISKHITEVSQNIRAVSRPAKNVLRVMLGIPPVFAKDSTKDGGTEELFPVKKTLGAISTREKSLTRRNRNSGHSDKKRRSKEESPVGDRAISNAMSRALPQKNGQPSKFAEPRDPALLELTAIETLLLSVICSQGLPIWTGQWEDLLDAFDVNPEMQGPGYKYAITWYGMGLVVESAAEVWHRTSILKLQDKRKSLAKATDDDGVLKVAENLEKIEALELDERIKRRALAHAKDYREDSVKLSKKCVMLLEALRRRMGVVEVKRTGASKKGKTKTKSDNGLGRKVLTWTGKELGRWAQCLGIMDGRGRPLAHTAADFITDLPRYSEDECYRVSAVIDKKSCRTIFSQIAQQTRSRSVALQYSDINFHDLLIKAVRNSKHVEDNWTSEPSWWINTTESSGDPCILLERDLLTGLLEYGYSGFEEMLANKTSFIRLIDEEVIDGDMRTESCNHLNVSRFSKACAQERANQLTRELDILDETESIIRMVGERRNRPGGNTVGRSSNVVSDTSAVNGVQPAIQAYFNSATPPPKQSVIVLSDSDGVADDNSVEIVSPKKSSSKRKDCVSTSVEDASISDKKKRKTYA